MIGSELGLNVVRPSTEAVTVASELGRVAVRLGVRNVCPAARTCCSTTPKAWPTAAVLPDSFTSVRLLDTLTTRRPWARANDVAALTDAEVGAKRAANCAGVSQ